MNLCSFALQELLAFSSVVGSEADVNEARHRGDELVLLRLTRALGVLQRGWLAVVDVGSVGRYHGRLRPEEQLRWRHARGAQARPDHRPGVVGRIPVEISAVPVLAGLGMHGDPDVDV